jgi:hypothetical protein
MIWNTWFLRGVLPREVVDRYESMVDALPGGVGGERDLSVWISLADADL